MGATNGIPVVTESTVDSHKDLVYSVWGVNLGLVNLMVGSLIVFLLLTGGNFSEYVGDLIGQIVAILGVVLVLFFTNALGGIVMPRNV